MPRELRWVVNRSLVVDISVECIEVGDDASDLNLSVFEATAAQLNEVSSTTNLFSESIDIDIVCFEFGEYGF